MSRTLPQLYMVTGQFAAAADFRDILERSLERGPKLVQLRAKGADAATYLDLAQRAAAVCRRFEVPLLLATTPELFARGDADGLHLSSDQLGTLDARPVAPDQLLSVSCHTRDDLERGAALDADILLLSPIKPTASHPELAALGWDGFRGLSSGLTQAIYGFGGLGIVDLDDAVAAGAAGIAATRGLWEAR
jgi:8-oxo-dGTP diphosphatase